MFSPNSKVVVSLNEIVNEDVAHKCAKLTFTEFKELFNLSSTKRHDDYDIKGEYKKIINYCKEVVKTNNKHIVNYGFVDGKTIGRLQSKNPSIQRLYNGFRGILCNGKMIDFDMKNCHPYILLNLCKKHNIKYNYLLDYIDNREQVLSDTMQLYNMTRSEAKSVFLSCLNDINVKLKINKRVVKTKSFFSNFDKEMTDIITKLYNIYKKDDNYKEYLSNAQFNPEGKFTNLILCDIENKYLNRAINKLIENKLLNKDDIAVLMFDGFMAYDKNNKDNVIDFLNKEFKNESIEWDYKEHNTELLEPLNKMNKSTSDFFIGEDIIEVVDHVLSGILKNKLVKCDGNIYYMGNNTIINNEKIIRMELYNLISKQNYFIDNGKTELKVSKIHNNIKNIVEALVNNSETNNSFISDVWDYTQYKMFFNNGYFDFKLNKFIEGQFNKTFIKINKDYVKSNNAELRQQINDKIFYPIFTVGKDPERLELLEYFKYIIGQYLAGNITLKRWSLFQGMRNSGKGIIGDLLKNCFEKYIMTTNSSNFNYKSSNNDAQKALSWLIDYEFVRIALTSEISISDDIKIDGNMIKKFTSGGDCISARKNFQDEKEFKIQSSLIVCCNDCPPIEPNDAIEFCDEFQMKSKFIDDDFDDNEKIKGYSYYKKDDNLKTDFLKREDVIIEIINMLFESYYNKCAYPENLLKEIKSTNSDDNDYIILKEIFTITNNEKDTIKNDDLKETLKAFKINFSVKKVKTLLKSQGAQDFRTNTKRGLKYVRVTVDDSDSEASGDEL